MRPVLVWRIRGASCSSFRWLRNSRKRALPRVVVHSVSILFLLQLTPLPRYGVLQLAAGFTGVSAYKRFFTLATAQLICANADIPANCGMNGRMAGATAGRPGNPRNATALAPYPAPGPAPVLAEASQTLDRPECECADPATSTGEHHYPCGLSRSKNPPRLQSRLFRFSELPRKAALTPTPLP